MTPDWTPLRHVLARFREQDVELPLWWRDDDAVSATHALGRLAALAETIQIKVHIAVIPDLADAGLGAAIAKSDQLVPVVHGWRHENHAPPEAKKSEFGHLRGTAPQEFTDGVIRLQQLFGDRLVKLFVPPWNRIASAYYPALTSAGLLGVSTFTPRENTWAAPGLVQINTHVDPVDWRGTRDLKDPSLLIEATVGMLEQRLQGEADHTEPFGYLTHHLVHTEHLWDFSRQFLLELLEGGATPHPITPLLEVSA